MSTVKNKTRFTISIVGYDHQSTKLASQEISNFFTNNNYNLLATVKLPVKKCAILSIRRCHFIYKESREQFVRERHKIVLFVDFDNNKNNDLPEKIKKVNIPPAVSVNIQVQNV